MFNCVAPQPQAADDKLLEGILSRVMGGGEVRFPALCPICGCLDVHLYFNRHKDVRGGLWVWCGGCDTYSHGSGRVPDWWINLPGVDENQLTHAPGILNNHKNAIDAHINQLIAK